MFEQVLSEQAVEAIDDLAPYLAGFYLAGGTGLALQLGHRKSYDLDFFSDEPFNTDAVLSSIPNDKVLFTSLGTVHCEVRGIRISLLYYEVPLLYPAHSWHRIRVADARDIAAEKLKTISQRGSKKDFIDLYALIRAGHSISDICHLFRQRFERSDINFYHVIKSLVFFEDGEMEPMPPVCEDAEKWNWDDIKSFFVENLHLFEKALELET
ncbi:MAG TPA: hypothetical protein ENH70_07385 [Desulfobacteraceae bacterium]|nr:MAG: hypothetical protein DRG82_05610 [Deltaproteobacteria bacterium]HDZ24343.1 hypothetical protein [Desulfobacteraceae bacterium]